MSMIPPRPLALLAATVIAAALGAPAPVRAEKADREKEIHILADRLTADDAKREAVYDGNVVITQGTMRITSAKIVVREDAQGYRTYIATGTPVTFREKRDNADDWIDGVAERAEFDDRSDTLRLYNNARLKSNQGELTGDFISYDRAKQFFQAMGAPPGVSEANPSRVKATIVPQKKGPDGKPAAPVPGPPLSLKPDAAPATESAR
jgi:lipopolysaccharide export system protein LptA